MVSIFEEFLEEKQLQSKSQTHFRTDTSYHWGAAAWEFITDRIGRHCPGAES
jgi:hypothetical protein